jgi:serine protease Do
MPRLPDWLLYLTIVIAVLAASLGRREHANAPRPPPPVPGEDQAPIAPSSPFANDQLVRIRPLATNRGTAFSLNDRGVWLTARRVMAHCGRPTIVVADGWGAPARMRTLSGDVAVLITDGGAPSLPLAKAWRARSGDSAFLPGFSGGGPGETAVLYLGGESNGRQLAWAEIGRTDGLRGALVGFAGAPVLNADGEVVGMALADQPRRGRLNATPPEALGHALVAAHVKYSIAQPGQPITLDNYGRAADSLRRDLSVAEVVCLPR